MTIMKQEAIENIFIISRAIFTVALMKKFFTQLPFKMIPILELYAFLVVGNSALTSLYGL